MKKLLSIFGTRPEAIKMAPVQRPDIVLVQGDTTTTMATSLAAFYYRVPVGHVEAGLRTRGKYAPFPEEINRRITGVIADLHFAPTPWARDNLLRERVRLDAIHITGNTVIDALLAVVKKVRLPEHEADILKYLRQRLPGYSSLHTSHPSRIAETQRLLDNQEAYRVMSLANNPYGDGRAADRIAAIIAEKVTCLD